VNVAVDVMCIRNNSKTMLNGWKISYYDAV